MTLHGPVPTTFPPLRAPLPHQRAHGTGRLNSSRVFNIDTLISSILCLFNIDALIVFNIVALISKMHFVLSHQIAADEREPGAYWSVRVRLPSQGGPDLVLTFDRF